MSKTSNQPMWPIRKIFPFRSPWPGASVTPCRSRRWRSSVAPVDALGRAGGGDHRGGVVVGREELEAHRLDPGARRAAEPDVPLERRLEAVVEDHPERHVEAADQRDGRRERRVEHLLRLPRRAPVEVEAPRRRQRVPERARRRSPSRGRAGTSAPSASRRRRRRRPRRRSRAAPRRATRPRRPRAPRRRPPALSAWMSATTPVEVSDWVQKTTPAPLSATAAPTSLGHRRLAPARSRSAARRGRTACRSRPSARRTRRRRRPRPGRPGR